MSMRRNQLMGRFFLTTSVLFILAVFMAGPVVGKSVYLSANHHTGQFDAWNIGSNGLVSKQATYTLNHALEPAGIAIDAVTGFDPVTGDPTPPLMFVTSEGYNGGIEVINPVTLQFHGVCPGPINMGGVDVDDIDNIIYAIQRGTSGYGGNGTSELYIYGYNDDGSGITQLAHITLPNHGYGMGLALDDSRDILWVGDIQYSMVRAYDVNVSDWNDIVEIPALSFSVSHSPIDVAVDSKRNLVYTVAGWTGSTLLSKYDVDTGVETTTDCGAGMGIAVEEIKGYVYMTRGGESGYYPPSHDDIAVWDCSTSPFTLLQDTECIGNPAGIAIGNVSYNPLNLAKNDVVQGYGVYIGQTFPYQITFDNFDNTFEATGVMVRDDLPVELDFVSETKDGTPGTGVYESSNHTVTWDIGTIPAGQAGPVIELVVKINQNATPNTTIYNFANIWCNQTDTTTEPGYDPDNPDPEPPPGTVILPVVPVAFDIKPGSCPNPLNVKTHGRETYTEDKDDYDLMGAKENPGQSDKPEGPKAVLPVAIVGTEEFDVADIDPTSVMLEGVPAVRWGLEDVATPLHEQAQECECNTLGPDGIIDLTLKFDRAAIIAALGEVYDRDTIPLTITGELYGGTPIEGTDCVWIIGGSEPEAAASTVPDGPAVLGLANFPNPFNPATEISFTLPRQAEVKLEVFNIMGQKVTTLIDGQMNAGEHSCVWDGSDVASGVYFYRLETPDFVDTKKMVLMK